MMALGLIETKGLLAAVEAADAMLKTAEVRLLERNLVGGGLVTITIGGEVSAVQAAVDAAVTAIHRISGAEVFSAHVIARPDDELTHILLLEPDSLPETVSVSAPVQATQSATCSEKTSVSLKTAAENKTLVDVEASGSAADAATTNAPVPVEISGEVLAGASVASTAYSAARLKAMSLNQLRELAIQLSGFPLSGEQIAVADKKSLIAEILRLAKGDVHK